MSKFFVKGKATTGPEDWKAVVGKGKWKTGYSAKALAYCWEEAGGFPPDVKQVFSGCAFSVLQEPELLIAFPEHKVPLPGGGKSKRGSSENDIFVLAKSQGRLITVAVEGKVDEDFDKPVKSWIRNISNRSGKPERLQFLKERLEIADRNVDRIRYQLLHRTASPLILAEQFNSRHAVMLVHSFSQDDNHFKDYQNFLDLLNADGEISIPKSVSYAGEKNGINLYLAWVRGEERFLSK